MRLSCYDLHGYIGIVFWGAKVVVQGSQHLDTFAALKTFKSLGFCSAKTGQGKIS
jgi:hypothetical protein